MIKFRSLAVLAVTAVLGQQLVACSSQVSATESERLAALWNGFHAEVRLVVYDDLNANLITLIGGVNLTQGANKLSGARLVIDLNSGRSTINGGGAPGTAPAPPRRCTWTRCWAGAVPP